MGDFYTLWSSRATRGEYNIRGGGYTSVMYDCIFLVSLKVVMICEFTAIYYQHIMCQTRAPISVGCG